MGPLARFENHWGPPSPTWGPVDLYLARNMSVIYVGALPLLAILALGLWQGELLRRRIWFLTAALCVTLAYALGRYTPAFTLLFDWLPGARLYRRPADAVFVLGMLLAFAGGYLVHRLLSEDQPAAKLWQRAGFAATVLALLGLCGGRRLVERRAAAGPAGNRHCRRLPGSGARGHARAWRAEGTPAGRNAACRNRDGDRSRRLERAE